MTLFDLIYLPLALVTAPKWAGKKRAGWAERFGRIEPLPARGERPRVLVHAVSVGEVNALRELVPLLTPHVELVVSATTDTGLKRAQELFGARCRVVRYPLDLSWSVRRFLDAVRPNAVALVELELWPNFVRECERRAVPVCVINGRLSERSFRGYSRIRRVIGPTFRRLSFAAVQDLDYAARFEHMGVDPNACLLTGSMKWDAARLSEPGEPVAGAAELGRTLGIDPTRPLVVAGSTGPGEEELLHRSLPDGTQLLCAPRKPERFDEAAVAMPGCVRRSRPGQGSAASRRFLLDTIGELRAAYSLADVVVVGRSFGDQYGSDPIEPIALGRPTLIGPAVSDFAQIVAEFEAALGIVRVTRETLAAALQELLADPGRRAALAAAGQACIRGNQGASSRHAELLRSLATNGMEHAGPSPRRQG